MIEIGLLLVPNEKAHGMYKSSGDFVISDGYIQRYKKNQRRLKELELQNKKVVSGFTPIKIDGTGNITRTAARDIARTGGGRSQSTGGRRSRGGATRGRGGGRSARSRSGAADIDVDVDPARGRDIATGRDA